MAIRVQSGETTGITTGTDVSVTAFDPDHTFLLFQCRTETNTVSSPGDFMIKGWLSPNGTDDEIHFAQGPEAFTDSAVVTWWLVEALDDEFTVQAIDDEIAVETIVDDNTITSVDTSRTMVVGSFYPEDITEASILDSVGNLNLRFSLVNSTTVRAEQIDAAGLGGSISNTTRSSYVLYVVEWASATGVEVIQHLVDDTFGATDQELAIGDTVEPEKTWFYATQSHDESGLEQVSVKYLIDFDNNEIEYGRQSPTSDYQSILGMQVVKFPDSFGVLCAQGEVFFPGANTAVTDTMSRPVKPDSSIIFCSLDINGDGTAFDRHVVTAEFGTADSDGYTDQIRFEVAYIGQPKNVSYFVVDFGLIDTGLFGDGTLSISASGTLVGKAALSGSASINLSGSGDLTARGGLSGQADLSVNGSANLAGQADLSGNSLLQLDANGTLAGAGLLIGSASATLTAAGQLTAVGNLVGSTSLQVTPVGTLAGSAAASGVAGLSISGSGDLSGRAALSGNSPLSISTQGDLAGVGVLVGDTLLQISVTGTLTDSGPGTIVVPLVGNAALSIDGSATLAARGVLAGLTSLTLDGSATLQGLGLGCWEALNRAVRAAVMHLLPADAVYQAAPDSRGELGLFVVVQVQVNSALQRTVGGPTRRHLKTGVGVVTVHEPVEHGMQQSWELADTIAAAVRETTIGAAKFRHPRVLNDGFDGTHSRLRVETPYVYDAVVP